MIRILENKTASVMFVVLFALALFLNTLVGGSIPAFGASPLVAPVNDQRADGPFAPPDPWDRGGLQVADGPFAPPDPWDRGGLQVADGPFAPPDPWDRGGLQRTDGPFAPPDPWDRGGAQRS